MQNFFCAKHERVKINRIYDYIMKNSNVKLGQIEAFNKYLSSNLGLENNGFDEVAIEEFEEEFFEHFKNNKPALDIWKIIKTELQINSCQIWV